MDGDLLIADQCTVLGVNLAASENNGPTDTLILTLLTIDGDTLSLAFTEDETKRLVSSIITRVGG